jgi:hypothetical protein
MIERYDTAEWIEGEILRREDPRELLSSAWKWDAPCHVDLALGHGPVVRNWAEGRNGDLRIYNVRDEGIPSAVDRWELISNTRDACVVRVWLTRPLQGPLLADYMYAVDGDTKEVMPAAPDMLSLINKVKARVTFVACDSAVSPNALDSVLAWLGVLEDRVKDLMERGWSAPAPPRPLDADDLKWRQGIRDAATLVAEQAVEVWLDGQDRVAEALRSMSVQLRELAEEKTENNDE